jgi:hypothetical protein
VVTNKAVFIRVYPWLKFHLAEPFPFGKQTFLGYFAPSWFNFSGIQEQKIS